MTDVAIIGAGPYGLSIAAHLASRGVDFRIFGIPMHTWRTQMPAEMRLKSEGFASTLYDPDGAFTLAEYCRQAGKPYADLGRPIPLETFVAYGQEFQKRLAPELEEDLVVSLERTAAGFQLKLAKGNPVAARRVVVAVGISHFQYMPPVLAKIPSEFLTHSSHHRTFEQFRGRQVTVIGGGASAADVAAALVEAGASAQIVARNPVIHFHNPPKPRSFWDSVRSPMTGLGPGWRSLMCTEAPLLFHVMPEKFRLIVVRKHLGPAPGWFVKDQIVGRVPFQLGFNIDGGYVKTDRVHLRLIDAQGEQQTLVSDHVIAATGYKVDLGRLAFLGNPIRKAIRSVEDTPVLTSNFESSVPGLYFVGAASANSFGPLARFAYGAGFTSRRLSGHLARSASKRSVPVISLPEMTTLQDR